MPTDEMNEEWQEQCENEERMIEEEARGSGMTELISDRLIKKWEHIGFKYQRDCRYEDDYFNRHSFRKDETQMKYEWCDFHDDKTVSYEKCDGYKDVLNGGSTRINVTLLKLINETIKELGWKE